MNVAIYVRVSTHEQAEEGYSIDEQISKLEKYCDIKSWNVYKIYKDPGYTGSNIERPGLQSMLLEAKLKRFDSVLVYKIDRLSRSQKDTLYIIEDILSANGIAFQSLNENFDTSTPFGKAMIGILAVFAQLEREQIKERMQMGKIGRAKSGKNMAWSRVPFGYDFGENRKLVINPLCASVVKRMYSDYLNGKSVSRLRLELNNEGHVGKDVKWSYRTVRVVLSNPVYKGHFRFKGELYEGEHEPIISEDMFDKVQKELKIRQQKAYKENNNPRPFQSKYMCSGMIKCKYCQSNLQIALGTKRKDETRSRKYICRPVSKSDTTQRMRKKCEFKPVFAEVIESHVLESLEQIRLDPTRISRENLDTPEINIEEIKSELDKLDKRMSKLMDLYIDGDIDKSVLDKKKEKLMKEQKHLMSIIENQESVQPRVSAQETIKTLDKVGKSVYELSYEDQKKLVNKLIHNIRVDNESIDITWNFSVKK